MEKAFVAYSQGKVQVPPIGELLFPGVNGEAHIKYGAVNGGEQFLVKVATGFADNAALGLPGFGGCMLLFSQRTGQLDAVLLEEGMLTNVRTAAAGAVAAKHLAPRNIARIGICGTGVQARLQADYLRHVTACRELIVWGRNQEKAKGTARDIATLGFRTSVAGDIGDITRTCNLIVTTTAAREPILLSADIQAGTHITAIGSDTKEKIELEPALVRRADIIAVDSILQSLERGEVYQAFRDRPSDARHLVEIGDVISDASKGRRLHNEISVADLTGVAVQDIMVAEAVYRHAVMLGR
jgi:ornithine cyclodeaminase